MLKRVIIALFIICIIFFGSMKIYSSESTSKAAGSSTSISYTIDGWNISGTITIQTSTAVNKISGLERRAIQLIDSKYIRIV